MPYKTNNFLIRLQESDARLILASLEVSFHSETLEMKRKIAKLTLRLRRMLSKHVQVTL